MGPRMREDKGGGMGSLNRVYGGISWVRRVRKDGHRIMGF